MGGHRSRKRFDTVVATSLVAVAALSFASFGVSKSMLMNPEDALRYLDTTYGRPETRTIKSSPLDILDELSILTSEPLGQETENLKCKEPLVATHNRVLREPRSGLEEQKIPRIFHVSFKGRCLPQDLARHVDRWKEKLPDYSVFFHDDDAVDALLTSDWAQQIFPDLNETMQCVRKGAMKTDVWRVLVIYKYGGVYTDIDNWPLDKFDQNLIEPDLSAFSFSDFANRPSQWFFAMDPLHPMAYYSMLAILKNVYQIPDITRPKVVFTTGPGAVDEGYTRFTYGERVGKRGGYITGTGGRKMRKIAAKNQTDSYIVGGYKFKDMVPLHGEERNVTRRQRVEIEGDSLHWKQAINKQVYMGAMTEKGSCKSFLKNKMKEAELNKMKEAAEQNLKANSTQQDLRTG
mmetsp:Transcript_17132/g.22293  ORF Transcript_17132/g.22293 Transcript_17132/m.22293 type:complete len:404 (+) Transcript_17132:156-1367(+)|eukprot:CAMPEP_0198149916 /NCGR_PEP_ID=MMETSP1443-20131203/48631_1 /TAXON_ID=186043 /ORGANISM="Entomoneis sp., Strain CCMP2396" /LENGTH=403 /DNA_ID=CAMNT_0043815079 /DNA_START=56 /DNA_END=1267 /DNA_ORIENTATION=+